MRRSLLAAASFAFFFAVLCQPALATVDRVSIDESRMIGHYLEAKGFMDGTAPGGRYRVPVTLLHPLSRGNGVGLLDVLNNANLVYAV
jgi:hypothetical protein